MACACRSQLLTMEFYLKSSGCSNQLWRAARIGSVEWEATRVGDVIGAKSWWRAKGRFSASAFASRTARHKSQASEVVACACRKSKPGILMMQSTQDRQTEDATNGLDSARYRRIFV